MSTLPTADQIIDKIQEIILKKHVTSLELSQGISLDQRINYHIDVLDTDTKNSFILLANTIEDVEQLFPRLLDKLVELRDKR